MRERVKGGKKNAKSGTTWSTEELKRVFEVYRQTGGKGLHESNPQIISLGLELGRTTRSVEAQMIMFRSIEKGEGYGYKNMNKAVWEIWNEYKLKKNMSSTQSNGSNQLEELFDWFGHRKGGVKIAFTDRGNPTGNVIQTDLINAMDRWVSNLVSSSNDATLKVFLIGGPGNGKTEALDYAIKKIIQKFDLPESIKKDIEFQAKESKRTVEVKVNNPKLPFNVIRLVQDASLGDSTGNAANAMLNDFRSISDQDSLYMCCINRGILQDVISLAKLKKKSKELELFSQLAKYMDGTNEIIENTWPISINVMGDNFKIGLWPMEISSLFEGDNNTPTTLSPFEQVLKLALENDGWADLNSHYSKESINYNYCPLLINHSTFKTNTGLNIKSFINEYELLTNHRLTFREMLSLTVYLLIGHENDFLLDGNQISIKEFTSKIIGKIRDHENKIVAYESCFQLAMLQLEFKLFNKWPDVSPILRDPAWKRFIELQLKNGRMQACGAFIRIFTKTTNEINRTDLEKTLHHLCSLLDPGKLYEDEIFNSDFNPSRVDLALQDSVSTLKKNYELSIGLSSLDKDVLNFFAQVEKDLDEIRIINNVNSINAIVERLNFILKKVTASYIKRKLGGYYGISSETTSLKKFNDFEGKNNNLRLVMEGLLGIKYLSPIRSKSFGSINIAINSTFGQPDFNEQDVRFNSNIIYDVSIYKPHGQNALQPISNTRFLKLEISNFEGNIKSFNMPFTYHLYKAIIDIKSGLKQGTMPRDIAATFDRMKSFMEGISVHEKNEDSTLAFPRSEVITISKILEVQK